MSIDDEELMAFVDGELDPARAGAVRAAIARDPVLAARAHDASRLRDRLRRAFDPVLDEPVPSRLSALVAESRSTASTGAGWRGAWTGGLGLAAGVLIGIAVGSGAFRAESSGQTTMTTARATTVADAALVQALDDQLASKQSSAAPVRIGITFVDAGGAYCRTFVARDRTDSVAGLACRAGGAWRLRALETVTAAIQQPGSYRQAGTELPPLIMQAAQNSMVGEPLDARAEADARARKWQPRDNGA